MEKRIELSIKPEVIGQLMIEAEFRGMKLTDFLSDLIERAAAEVFSSKP